MSRPGKKISPFLQSHFASSSPNSFCPAYTLVTFIFPPMCPQSVISSLSSYVQKTTFVFIRILYPVSEGGGIHPLPNLEGGGGAS